MKLHSAILHLEPSIPACDGILSFVLNGEQGKFSIFIFLQALLAEGAVTFVVPGNFPIGCHASYLTIYQSQDSNEYDASGCLKWLNGFAQLHNHLLQDELNRLREIYPHAKIMYADYYNAAIDLFRIPDQLGKFTYCNTYFKFPDTTQVV